MPTEFKSTIHRFSITPGVVPHSSELLVGELALNAYDGSLFTLTSSGTITDLTSLQKQFNLTAAVSGDILMYDLSSQKFKPANVATVFLQLDGGTF